MKTTTTTLMLVLGLAAAGCTAEATDDTSEQPKEESTGKATSAFAAHGNWSEFVVSKKQDDLGAVAPQACFLTGVTGDLEVRGLNFGGWSKPFVGVQPLNGEFIFTVNPTSSFEVGGGVGCVSTGRRSRTDPVSFSSSTAQPGQAVLLAPVAPGRRCFLTAVGNNQTNSQDTFGHDNDFAQVFVSGTNWYLGGTGNVFAQGACMEVTQVFGAAANVGGGEVDLGVDSPGKECYLTAIGGAFRHDDWNDGVQITFDPGLLDWRLKVSAGKTGAVECAR